jgi:hypothetical protein
VAAFGDAGGFEDGAPGVGQVSSVVLGAAVGSCATVSSCPSQMSALNASAEVRTIRLGSPETITSLLSSGAGPGPVDARRTEDLELALPDTELADEGDGV